jgi:hypothetical protein
MVTILSRAVRPAGTSYLPSRQSSVCHPQGLCRVPIRAQVSFGDRRHYDKPNMVTAAKEHLYAEDAHAPMTAKYALNELVHNGAWRPVGVARKRSKQPPHSTDVPTHDSGSLDL